MGGIEEDADRSAERMLADALLLDDPGDTALAHVDEGLRAVDLGEVDRRLDRVVLGPALPGGEMAGPNAELVAPGAEAREMRRRAAG